MTARRGRRAWSVVVLSFVLVLASCGGDDDAVDTTDVSETTVATDTTGGPSTTGAVAAGGGCANDDGSLRETTMLLPFPFAVPFFPVFVAQARGYFEEEGIEVTVESADGSASVVQQVAAGNVDFGMSDPGPMIAAVDQGQELTVVYVFQSGLIYGLVTPEGSPFTSIPDLAGETVGVSEATAGEVPFLEALLASNGVDPETDVEIVESGGGASTAAAFDGDRIVAYFSDFFNIIELGFEVPLTSFDLGEFGLLHAASVVVSDELIDGDPELIACVTRAMARATEFTHASPEAAIIEIGEAFPDQVTDPEGFDLLAINETIARTGKYEESDDRWGFNRPASWQGYVDLLSASGELAADTDPTTFYTNDFIDRANDFDAAAEQAAAEDVAAG
jgi:NitT/TauT family transport system substrate-binding protein